MQFIVIVILFFTRVCKEEWFLNLDNKHILKMLSLIRVIEYRSKFVVSAFHASLNINMSICFLPIEYKI